MQRQPGPGESAPNPGHSIFRPQALQHYRQGRDQAVLPRLVTPRTFRFLWLLLALIAGGGSATWFVRVPVYAAGQAVIVDGRHVTPPGAGTVAVVFLAAGQQAQLRTGQALFLDLDPATHPIRLSLLAVESQVISPADARTRFNLGPGATAAISRPVAVAYARLESTPAGLAPAAYTGSTFHATVEVGARRALALAPIIGEWLGA